MANITEKYQQAKDAGYSDAEIQAFMAGAMKTGGPGVDKPGLPDSRTMPTPKNFPGFGNPAAEYARRQEPVNRMLDGAARMTRPGADAKFGGAADIMLGAGEIAAPLVAVPLAGASSIGAGAAMLGRMALGAGGGYLGGKLLRAQVPKDQPGLQDFAESVGTTAGGLLAGGAAESPKIGAFIKGAAREVPKKLPGAMLAGAAGHAIGRPGTMAILEAMYAGPSIIRSGMAEAAGKPWLGPVFSGILGKNKPQPVDPSTAGTYGVRNFDVGPPIPTPAPANFSLQSGTAGRPPAPPLPAAAGTYGIKNFDVGAPRPMSTPSNASLQSGTAGRPSGLLATELSLTARQEEALRNIEAFKARQAAKQNPRPTPTPTPTAKPTAKPTAPSENMASRMAAQDAAGQERTGLMNDVVAEAEKRGAWNEAGGKFFENATDLKQNALIKFAAEKGKPMQRFSESEYNALVKEFNATKPLHPIDGAPWRLERAGANYKPGKKAGRDVETTLRHFNNMRLGKK